MSSSPSELGKKFVLVLSVVAPMEAIDFHALHGILRAPRGVGEGGTSPTPRGAPLKIDAIASRADDAASAGVASSPVTLTPTGSDTVTLDKAQLADDHGLGLDVEAMERDDPGPPGGILHQLTTALTKEKFVELVMASLKEEKLQFPGMPIQPGDEEYLGEYWDRIAGGVLYGGTALGDEH